MHPPSFFPAKAGKEYALTPYLEEYGRSRAKFRWMHMVALARVTASAGGQPAPGVAEARNLLGL